LLSETANLSPEALEPNISSAARDFSALDPWNLGSQSGSRVFRWGIEEAK
jgi:hypothetical protein